LVWLVGAPEVAPAYTHTHADRSREN
jgi:hypothetical protein